MVEKTTPLFGLTVTVFVVVLLAKPLFTLS